MKDNLLVFAIILIASVMLFSSVTDSKPKNNSSDFEQRVTIEPNETLLSETNLEGNSGWKVGQKLYIGGILPTFDDDDRFIDELYPGGYKVTVTILETVIYDDLIKVI